MHVIKTREIPMTLLAPSHSPLTPEEGLPQLPALLRYEQERAHGRPKYPARSPVFPQAPTEPRPAALVYPARSQTHSVGPTPQDGSRLRPSSTVRCSTFVVNGGCTSHVDLGWVGRELRPGE